MIKVPFGDLNDGSIVVTKFGRVSLPRNLADESSEVQQHLVASKLFLQVVQ